MESGGWPRCYRRSGPEEELTILGHCYKDDWTFALGMIGYLSGTCKRVMEDRPCNCRHPIDLTKPSAYHLYKALSSKRNLPKLPCQLHLEHQTINTITHINIYMTPSHKPTGLTRQEHTHPIQLLGPPHPPHRRHRSPMLHLPLQQRLTIQRRVHVSRRNDVAADTMRCPFAGQRFRELGDGRFGSVVGALLLRVQHAGTRDGGEEDDGAAAAGGDHVVRAGLGDEEGARQVDVHDVPEAGRGIGFRLDLGAGNGDQILASLARGRRDRAEWFKSYLER